MSLGVLGVVQVSPAVLAHWVLCGSKGPLVALKWLDACPTDVLSTDLGVLWVLTGGDWQGELPSGSWRSNLKGDIGQEVYNTLDAVFLTIGWFFYAAKAKNRPDKSDDSDLCTTVCRFGQSESESELPTHGVWYTTYGLVLLLRKESTSSLWQASEGSSRTTF